MTPNALEVERNTLSSVKRSFFSFSFTAPCSVAYSFMRCPIMGVAIAWRISG